MPVTKFERLKPPNGDAGPPTTDQLKYHLIMAVNTINHLTNTIEAMAEDVTELKRVVEGNSGRMNKVQWMGVGMVTLVSTGGSSVAVFVALQKAGIL